MNMAEMALTTILEGFAEDILSKMTHYKGKSKAEMYSDLEGAAKYLKEKHKKEEPVK